MTNLRCEHKIIGILFVFSFYKLNSKMFLKEQFHRLLDKYSSIGITAYFQDYGK